MDMQNGGGMADMVKAMAGLPEDKRQMMVRDRLETFAEIRRSRDAVNTYDDAAYRADIGARNEHQRAQLRETQAKANAFYGRTGR